MKAQRVMLLIDADNVSVGVMAQAVEMLERDLGAVHVRRAYCTAESAVKHQAAFKRLGVKPMVNLAAGKNSTDIAMAVDAIDLVLQERPDVVVIASSDSDFAPLVLRLREKGCRVLGVGQRGKTGAETMDLYDGYTEFFHTADADADADAPKAAAKKAPAKRSATAAKKTAATKTAAKSVPAKKTAVKADAPATAPAPAAKKAAPRKAAPAPAPQPAPPAGADAPTLQAILDCLPELASGQPLPLNLAAERLRQGKLLSRSNTAAKLLARHAERLELLPADQPKHVRLRG